MNKPVAWILGGHLDSAKKMPHLCRVAPTQQHEGYIPLYTQKQLEEASKHSSASLTCGSVAIRYDFDGYGYQYIDSGSGSDWQIRVKGEPLYTHPHPDNLGLAESIIKQQQLKIDNLLENNARLDAEIEVLKSHPAKELTDELNQLLYSVNGDAYLGKDKEEELVKIVRKQYTKTVKELTDEEVIDIWYEEQRQIVDFARAILRKAQE